MDTKRPLVKKKEKDYLDRVFNAATEEVEKFGQSIASQFTETTQEKDLQNPISEAMQQKTEDQEKVKTGDLNVQKKFVRTREELDNELKKIRDSEQEKLNTWSKNVNENLKIVNPGENIKNELVIPLTTKPKRGMMPGMPGTAKGGSGMEVVKSKQ